MPVNKEVNKDPNRPMKMMGSHCSKKKEGLISNQSETLNMTNE